jgi:hypothetical protein
MFRRHDIFPIISTTMSGERIRRESVLNMIHLTKQVGAGCVEILPIRPAGRAGRH